MARDLAKPTNHHKPNDLCTLRQAGEIAFVAADKAARAQLDAYDADQGEELRAELAVLRTLLHRHLYPTPKPSRWRRMWNRLRLDWTLGGFDTNAKVRAWLTTPNEETR